MVTPVIRACGRTSRTRCEHRRVSRAHLAALAQVEPHAADVGLVRDVGRIDFHHDRIAERFARRRPLRPRCARAATRATGMWNAASNAFESALESTVVPAASAAARSACARFDVRRRVLAQRPRRLHEHALVAIERRDVREHLDRGLGRAEHRDAARWNSARPSVTCSSPIHAASSGLSDASRAASITARATSVGDVIACGVRITSTPSTAGVRETRAHRRGVARGVGVADDVDRIAVRPVRRAARAAALRPFPPRAPRAARPRSAARSAASTPGPAAVGHDREALAARPHARRERDARRRRAAPMVVTRTAPVRRSAASNTSSRADHRAGMRDRGAHAGGMPARTS